jgi:hypothetical protein
MHKLFCFVCLLFSQEYAYYQFTAFLRRRNLSVTMRNGRCTASRDPQIYHIMGSRLREGIVPSNCEIVHGREFAVRLL